MNDAGASGHQGDVIVDIGGLRFALTGLADELLAQARERYRRFLADGPAHLTLAFTVRDVGHAPGETPLVERRGERRYRVSWGALEAELDLEAGLGRATVPPSVYLVDSVLRISTTLLALEHEALLVHSSGVRVAAPGDGDRVLVCFGPSGVGKTTVASSVERARVLCDEMMLLKLDPSDGGARLLACGTPFHGDLGFSQPGEAEALALVRLHQAPDERLRPLTPGQAAHALLNSILFFCRDEELAERLLGLALRISAGRTYHLSFKRETHVPTFVGAHLGRDAAQGA